MSMAWIVNELNIVAPNSICNAMRRLQGEVQVFAGYVLAESLSFKVGTGDSQIG
jgi:hypothetical protein